jgi:uncharacterized protein YodC (DUF2158 family)
MEQIENKIYFQPGDIVTLNKDIPNKPIMYVIKKETRTFRPDLKNLKEDFLLGIKCRWFTSLGELQESVFSTKDLTKLEQYNN